MVGYDEPFMPVRWLNEAKTKRCKHIFQPRISGMLQKVQILFHHFIPNADNCRNMVLSFSKKWYWVLAMCAFAEVALAQGQAKVTLSGILKDGLNGETLIGATVFCTELKVGSASNVYGFYSLTLPAGTYRLRFSYTGYASTDTVLALHANTVFNLEMKPASKELKEVTIRSERNDANVQSTTMSTTMLKMETIKKIPALMGEVDLIKAIQLLPGVQTGGEGSAGFFVRGGGFDQNLILLDEAPVYNASHLMGFFSVFNQDAIRDAQLYKGGIPAQFGGRLSSVLEVRMKEGNSKQWTLSGGIGTLSSRLTVEGPIMKDKMSFMISGRRNYVDLLLNLSKDEELKNSNLYFYDLNIKLNYQINANNRLYLSGYFGRDLFRVSDLFLLGWGNGTGTLRWNHTFSSRHFSNLTLIHSNFNYSFGVPKGMMAFRWDSKIIDNGLKYDGSFFPSPTATIKYGVQSIYHRFVPANIDPLDENKVMTPIRTPVLNAWENSAYIGIEKRFGSRFEFNIGLRYSGFSNIGPASSYAFEKVPDSTSTLPLEQQTFTMDTVNLRQFESGEFYHTWHGPEPRLAVRYSITDRDALKLGYNRMRQYIQVGSVAANSSPLDTWFPASPNVKPQIADQVGLGYFRNFLDNSIETSVEIYHKWMQNSFDFRDHANVFLNPAFEGELRYGTSRSYGIECMVRKTSGKLSGWVAYTYSRVLRTIPGINRGQSYPASFDRPHNLTIVGSYSLNKRWEVSATFLYYTGAPLTAPAGRYEYQGMIVPVFTNRNAARMPDYHRLDLGATLHGKEKPGRHWHSSWMFAIYNVYNRYNAFMINFRQSKDDPKVTEAVMTYYFFIIPSVTYNFRF